MRNILVNFTDSYGLHHEAAVVEVSYGNKTVSAYETIGVNPGSQTSVSITMQYRYWHSIEAREAGARPLEFSNKAGTISFGTSLQSVEEVSDLELFCLSYFANIILPEEGGTLVLTSEEAAAVNAIPDASAAS